MAVNPWTDAETAKLRELHAAGRSMHSIAAEMKRSKQTVSTHSVEIGLTWDRSKTAAATEARVIDFKARRTSIVARMYDDTEHVLTQLENGRNGKGWQSILKGTFGVEEARNLDFIPSRDRRDMADVLTRNITTAAKLEAIDANAGVERERSLLTQLGEALGVTGPAE